MAAVAALAARQHGVVSRAQLASIGVRSGSISWWIETGRLHRVRRGVFAVGHAALRREGTWMAAVLACGDGAVLSHRDAAALWELRPTARPRVDVTVPRSRAAVAGVDLHRSRRLDTVDVTRRERIPVTTVARTVVDLADVLGERGLESVLERAEALRALDVRAVEDARARAPGRRGHARLERALSRPPELTRSELERRFLKLCADHGLPAPGVNRRIAGLEVDFLWRDRALAAETDGWAHHRTRSAFERDRERDQRLAREGVRVLRFSYRQVERAPAEVAETLRAALRWP